MYALRILFIYKKENYTKRRPVIQDTNIVNGMNVSFITIYMYIGTIFFCVSF